MSDDRLPAARIAAELTFRGMSQADLANRVGMSAMAVTRRQARDVPWRTDELLEVARVLDMPLPDLFAPWPDQTLPDVGGREA